MAHYTAAMPTEADKSLTDIAAALGGSMPANTVVSEVAKRLLSYFTSGRVQPGTRLPPERQLAASLGVGRSAVREALAALDILGIVHIRPGSGTYLRGSASELLPQTLSWGLMLGEPRTRELIEIRHGLEAQAARLAAERATDDNIKNLDDCLRTMRENLTNLEAFVEGDMLFHREVGEAANNVVLRDLLQSARSLLRVWAERALRDEGHAHITLEQHHAVLRAIQARDGDGAARAMAAHMDSASGRLLRAFRSERGSQDSEPPVTSAG